MRACTGCGKCCLKYADGGLSATPKEIDYWFEHRPDIARFVREGRIWMDPDSGEPLAACPFLRPVANGRYSCGIYQDRPDDCRDYPVLVSDMIVDGCEMLESHEVDHPARVQEQLDRLRWLDSP